MSNPEVARTASMHEGDNRDSGLIAGCLFYLSGCSGGCFGDLELTLKTDFGISLKKQPCGGNLRLRLCQGLRRWE